MEPDVERWSISYIGDDKSYGSVYSFRAHTKSCTTNADAINSYPSALTGNDCSFRSIGRVFERPISSFHLLQLSADFFIGVVDDNDVKDRGGEQQGSPRNEPSRKPVNRDWLIKPPSTLFWRLLFFGSPGLACSIAGFILLNGPHRRPRLGVALYFLGLILFAASALTLV